MSENLYEAPKSDVVVENPNSDAVRIREEHISTESSLKAMGILYYLGGIVTLTFGIGMFVNGGVSWMSTVEFKIFAVVLLLGLLSLWGGWGLRRLKPSVRVAVGVVSGFGLLSFPVGTIINGYFLWLTFGRKGRFVFSEEYSEIRRQTPEVKMKTSKVAWILLGVLVLILVGIIGFAMTGS